ncbi:MAG: dethiobiotin synthase [Crocinitomicaceae bacterium]|nr:dethiobiotin synthase [Crocinitomicaceae bacterium]NGF75307.1 dethiobiotin synthase [Fluviicola sp. SGL-29]
MNRDSSTIFFVSGIGTDVGKTVVAAILSEALNAHYWKPIQSGDLDHSDSMKVQGWTENVTVLEECYRLTKPLSPHTSARLDGVTITTQFPIPEVDGTLIIEGAGGVLVPVNDRGNTISEIVAHWDIPAIIVVKHYLGSINHTLLTLEYLKTKGIRLVGLVVTGEAHEESEKIIETITGNKVNLHIPFAAQVDAAFIRQQALIHKEKIEQWLLG